MSIFKDTFRDYVQTQFDIRRNIIRLGNPADFTQNYEDGTLTVTGIRERDRLESNTVKLQNGNKVTLSPGVFYNYTLNKQCVIRMTSLVDYVDNVGLEIGDLDPISSFTALKGATLSQNFILEGGVLSNFARNLDRDNDGNTESVVRRVNQPRRPFPRPNQKTNLGYGDFAIGSDANIEGFGIVPMPGIINAEIRTKSAYGSLREARVDFVCHNRKHLEILEMLYMRPGYTVLLEWGWSPFINNDGKLVDKFSYVENKTQGKIYTNAITLPELYNAINSLKEESAGNYDGLPGFIKNFGYKARPDGGYDCFTELISMGEVLDSLKVPNISSYNKESGEEVTDYGFSYDLLNTSIDSVSGMSSRTNVDKAVYNRASNKGIIPKKNGLLGLCRALYNASIFNSNYFRGLKEGEGGTGSEILSDSFYEDETKEVLRQYDNDLGPDTRDLATYESPQANDTNNSRALRSGYQREGYDMSARSDNADIQNYLVDLLRFESTSIFETLHKKLQIPKEDLKNFFIYKKTISKNPNESTSDVTIPSLGNSQKTTSETYIRWDALCILINNNLIPKDEKGFNPISLVSDRIYDVNTKTSKYDPLLYCAITTFDDTTNENPINDFSCDPNICILPHQFELETANAEANLGYKPETNQMPVSHTVGVYQKGSKNIIYNNASIDVTSNFSLATNEDKIRRIGGIFINLKMLLNLAEQNEKNENYTIGRFIKDIWDKVNEACPLHNFVVTDDKESNTIFVLDLPVDNTSTPDYKDLYQFIPMSNQNTLREFDIQSEVPSTLSSTIAIQAQDPRNVQDIDGVTFAAFNKSIKNRIFSSDTEPNWKKVKDNINNRKSELLYQNAVLEQILKTYAVNFFRNLTLKANNQELIGTTNVVGVLKTYQTNNAYLQQAHGTIGTFNSVIPLNFNLTTDGISGVVIGNLFKIKKDRLPKAYDKSNIGFIVFNESQTITSGQDWTTKLGGKMVILDDKKQTVTGTIVYKTQEETATERDRSTRQQAGASQNDLDPTQQRGVGVGKLEVGDDIYLKRLKVFGIKSLQDPHGVTNVRNTPLVDNESGGPFGQNDNNIGMLNAWTDGGLKLGTIKEKRTITFEDGSRMLYPDALSKYDITNRSFRFIPNATPSLDETGKEYWNVNIGSTAYPNIKQIYKEDTTDIESIWFNIIFDPVWDDKFLNGWVLTTTDLVGTTHDPTGADYMLPEGITLSEYTKGTGNAWLQDSVLAPDFASAVDMNDNNFLDYEEYTDPSLNAGITEIETYKSYSILKGNPNTAILDSNEVSLANKYFINDDRIPDLIGYNTLEEVRIIIDNQPDT